MKSKVALAIELILIILYLVLVIFVIDKSNMVGLIIIGVITVVIFSIVLVLEKKREAQTKFTGSDPSAPIQQNTAASQLPTQTPPQAQNQPQQPQNPPVQ